MTHLYPDIEPFESGQLDVGEGHSTYWESVGTPEGKPALVLHGGPGSGCTPWHRRLFNPKRYRAVLLDQRNCGRSTPHASQPEIDLSANTTWHLVADLERLREQLGIDAWLVLGGSWGSTLALAYAERHPERVSELVLFGVTAGQHAEFDRVFRGGLADRFPTQWEHLRDAVRPDAKDGRELLEAVHQLLFDPAPVTRARVANEWCLWESASPEWPPTTELLPRFQDPSYALAFSRIVTHYALHYGWLEDGKLLAGADALRDIPAVLINGEHDEQTTDGAEQLARRLPRAEHTVVPDAGHAASNERIAEAIVAATDSLAQT